MSFLFENALLIFTLVLILWGANMLWQSHLREQRQAYLKDLSLAKRDWEFILLGRLKNYLGTDVEPERKRFVLETITELCRKESIKEYCQMQAISITLFGLDEEFEDFLDIVSEKKEV